VTELYDRLNKLADRGMPRGFDDVFDAAARRASVGVVDDDLAEMEDDDGGHDVIPFVTAELSRRRPRRRFGSLIAAAGMAALLLVGMLAVTALVGSGGASTPESAVQRLADAVSHGDPLAASDVMAPEELRSLHDTVDTAQKRAAELKLVQSASAPLAGLNLSVDNLHLRVEPMADGYAKVVIDNGTLHASTHKTKFSPVMQKVLRDSTDNSTDIDLTHFGNDNPVQNFVVTVRHDGKWYVSAAYTALEYFREYNNLTAATVGAGQHDLANLGASTPDDAVKGVVQALASNDWDKLFALSNPDELPLYDYREAIKQYFTQRGTATSFAVDKLDTTSQVHGDTASVVMHFTGHSDNGPWSLNGGCLNPGTNGSVDVFVNSPNYAYCFDATKPPDEFLSLFGVTTLNADAQLSTQAVTVVRRDGRWFVNPVSSALDVLNGWIAHLTQSQLYTMLRIPQELPAKGSITLGQPFTVPASSGVSVYTLVGHNGQQLVGLSKVVGTSQRAYVDLGLYDPDGKSVDNDPFQGYPVQLSADGTYKLVLFNRMTTDVNVTLWNLADAPTEAKTPYNSCNYAGPEGGCVPAVGGTSGILGTGGSTSVSLTAPPITAVPVTPHG
jgi:hypothetical protein